MEIDILIVTESSGDVTLQVLTDRAASFLQMTGPGNITRSQAEATDICKRARSAGINVTPDF